MIKLTFPSSKSWYFSFVQKSVYICNKIRWICFQFLLIQCSVNYHQIIHWIKQFLNHKNLHFLDSLATFAWSIELHSKQQQQTNKSTTTKTRSDSKNLRISRSFLEKKIITYFYLLHLMLNVGCLIYKSFVYGTHIREIVTQNWFFCRLVCWPHKMKWNL